LTAILEPVDFTYLRQRWRDERSPVAPLAPRPAVQRLCNEIEAATDLAFFGGLEASANSREAEDRATTGTNQNQDAGRARSRRRRQADVDHIVSDVVCDL
jgi:hypothetical protein